MIDTQFRQLTDAMPHIVWTMQADGQHSWFNQTWLDYTGLSMADSLVSGWSGVTHPDDLQRASQHWAAALEAGESCEMECRVRRADGVYRWMLGRAVPQHDTQGQRTQWLGTLTDIDDLKQAAAHLERDIFMNRIAGRVARLGGWTIELPDRKLTWSDENCLIHDVPPGYQPTLDEGIGYFLPEHRHIVTRHVQDCVQHGIAYEFVLPKMTARGRRIWVRSLGEAVRDEAGNIIRIQGAFQDITELRQQELEILRLNGELEQRVQLRTAQLAEANEELEAFAYSVSHDLRSPLNTIHGFSQLLLKIDAEHISEKGKHYLNRIVVGVEQMGQLIEGLLTLAHLSREEIKSEIVDLSAMARAVLHEYQEKEPSRQAAVQIQDGLIAQGDPRLLAAVLQNLLANAWKFSAKKPAAQIVVGSTPSADGETIFFVKDNGAGFDMAFAHKLFGTFERLHSPGDFVGTGIGLATVKRVIDRHGGRVWAESKPGQGATFFFTLKPSAPAVR